MNESSKKQRICLSKGSSDTKSRSFASIVSIALSEEFLASKDYEPDHSLRRYLRRALGGKATND